MASSTAAVPQSKAAQNGSRTGGTVAPSKAQAIHAAFKALGAKAPNRDVQGYLEQKFGMKASNYYIGEQRSKLLKKSNKAPANAPNPSLAQQARIDSGAVAVQQTNHTEKTTSATVVANTVVAMNRMAKMVGWDEVANLLDVLRNR